MVDGRFTKRKKVYEPGGKWNLGKPGMRWRNHELTSRERLWNWITEIEPFRVFFCSWSLLDVWGFRYSDVCHCPPPPPNHFCVFVNELY
jgi:hypothetical protein